MSEQNPSETAPEYHTVEQTVFSSEPDRLPPAAHAATDFDDGTDVLPEDEERPGEETTFSGGE